MWWIHNQSNCIISVTAMTFQRCFFLDNSYNYQYKPKIICGLEICSTLLLHWSRQGTEEAGFYEGGGMELCFETDPPPPHSHPHHTSFRRTCRSWWALALCDISNPFPLGKWGKGEEGGEGGGLTAHFPYAGRPSGTNIYMYDNEMAHFSSESGVAF